ncbi:hypothetical protein, partial [Mesomycoplasma ovipneumoniae]
MCFDSANFSIIFLNMMVCCKFNRLEIYKFMAFDYGSFKTSYFFRLNLNKSEFSIYIEFK